MMQATLGVVTILMYVPVELGVLHQAGALTAWTASLWLLHSVRFVKVAARAAKHIRPATAPKVAPKVVPKVQSTAA